MNDISLPSIFVSHGAPTMVLQEDATQRFLKQLGGQLPRPRVILCVSAHWTTQRPALSAAPWPETMHDFFGFPDVMYGMTYPAAGDPVLAEQARRLIEDAGIECDLHPERGLDHGAWVPLLLMYPEADIPVVQLSVQPRQPAEFHYRVGKALASLRSQGVLILASGGATHNLRDARFDPQALTADYVMRFADWLERNIKANNLDELLNYKDLAPDAAANHPTPEHLLPLYVALGAGVNHSEATALHRAYAYRSLALDAYAWY
jgi:4,5-DOPA dioxygenase extradiol